MRKVYCAVLMTVALLASAQTKIKPQPASQPLAKQKPMSEPFAKAALHVVIALHDSDGTSAGNEHIKTLFEDMEIEQSTPEETAITQNLKLWSAVHDPNVNTFNTWMTLTSGVNGPWTPEHVLSVANDESGIEKDFTCFDAYRVSLKAHASTIPEDCRSEKAIVGTKAQQEERRVRDACLVGKTRPDEIDTCFPPGKK